MNDREQLELAAKAAGYALYECDGKFTAHDGVNLFYFNPLNDDGDALRLAVKLRITPRIGSISVTGYDSVKAVTLAKVPYGGDPLAATRRAIVRAAAEIWKGMK